MQQTFPVYFPFDKFKINHVYSQIIVELLVAQIGLSVTHISGRQHCSLKGNKIRTV